MADVAAKAVATFARLRCRHHRHGHGHWRSGCWIDNTKSRPYRPPTPGCISGRKGVIISTFVTGKHIECPKTVLIQGIIGHCRGGDSEQLKENIFALFHCCGTLGGAGYNVFCSFFTKIPLLDFMSHLFIFRIIYVNPSDRYFQILRFDVFLCTTDCHCQ